MIRKIMHRPQAVIGLAMMFLVFLVMLFAPALAPNDPMQLNVAHSFAQRTRSTPLERTNLDVAFSRGLSMGPGLL